MTLPPLLLDEVRQWLRKSLEDLQTAEAAFGSGLYGPAAFHCQQAAEKSLKAFLVYRQQGFRKTHNLEEIGNACALLEPSIRPAAVEAATLTEYAWLFRYPGAPREIDASEAAEAMRRANGVFNEVLGLVPRQTHP